MPTYASSKSKVNFQIFSIANLEKEHVCKWFKILTNSTPLFWLTTISLTYKIKVWTWRIHMRFRRHLKKFIAAVQLFKHILLASA